MDKIEELYQHGLVIVVPGGGVFADQVRDAQQQWCFDDRTAHCMALLAMQQMALLFIGLKKKFVIARSVADIQQYNNANQIVVWSPDIVELDQAGIPANWDITSDSLAVWLAASVRAQELLLVKCAEIKPNLSLSELAKRGIIDKAFCYFAARTPINIQLINAQSW